MPATTSDTARIRKNLKAFAFADLFNELGWDRYDTEWPVLEADGHRFRLTGVAEKRGMVVVECAPVDGVWIDDSPDGLGDEGGVGCVVASQRVPKIC